MTRYPLLIALAFALLLAGFACSSDNGNSTTTSKTTVAAGATNAASGATGDQTIDIAMRDNSFDPDKVTVTAGSTVTFNISNKGELPHNVRIAGQDGEYDTADDAVSDPQVVQAGNTATLNWTVPGQSGDYKFRCDIHPSEMTGTITTR